MEIKENKKVSETKEDNSEEGQYINVCSPARHLKEMKEFYIAQLTSLIKYYEMIQAIYGEDYRKQIKACENKIDAVKNVVNGETLSRGPMRTLRWGTEAKWLDASVDFASCINEFNIPNDDLEYTKIIAIRKAEAEEAIEAERRKYGKNE